MRTLGLRGSELAHSDNPSVMALRETAMTAPFTQGSRGCSRTSAFFDGSRTLAGDCDRRESLERVTPVCALVHNDALYASTYYTIRNTPCASFGAQGVFWDSRRSDKTPETGRFLFKKPGARRRTHSRCQSPDRRRRRACRSGSWQSPRSPARSREHGCQW